MTMKPLATARRTPGSCAVRCPPGKFLLLTRRTAGPLLGIERNVFSFQRTYRRERLFFDTSSQGVGAPVSIPSRDAALSLLREIGCDPWGRAELRQLYAK